MAKNKSTQDLLDKLKRLRKSKNKESTELKQKIKKVIRKLDKRVDAIHRKLSGDIEEGKRQLMNDYLVLIEIQRQKAMKVLAELELNDE